MLNRKRKKIDYVFKFICRLLTWLTVALLMVLLYHIVNEGISWVDLQFLTSFPSRFADKAGIKAGIFGTLWLMGLTASISIPIGVASAIFLEEYGIKGKWGKVVEINVANLAGVPSIVYGLLGLTLFVRFFQLERSLLSGALTLSLLIMPVIIVASREALRAVPKTLKEAAYALGAEKWQVTFGQVLPAALPGILTGIILALSRAIGETAPLIIVGALTYVAFIPQSPMDEFTILPLQIYNWASRPQVSFHSLAAGGIIVLLSAMLIMNFIAVVIRLKAQKKVRM
jgi:phosphate transport system permease protein